MIRVKLEYLSTGECFLFLVSEMVLLESGFGGVGKDKNLQMLLSSWKKITNLIFGMQILLQILQQSFLIQISGQICFRYRILSRLSSEHIKKHSLLKVGACFDLVLIAFLVIALSKLSTFSDLIVIRRVSFKSHQFHELNN